MPRRRRVYRGRKTSQISFPLGGIGTGCIGIAGNGRLMDWEIFNRPNKGSYNGFSHFAIKAEQDGRVLDARVLNGDLPPPYMGQIGTRNFEGYGFGPSRQTLAGMPHFKTVRFIGEFPIAELGFDDKAFPGKVALTAFNPLIPHNDIDSGIPAAFFEIEVRNTSSGPIDYTICAVLGNPLPEPNTQTFEQDGTVSALRAGSTGFTPADTAYGDITLATDCADVSVQQFWYRGSWNDDLEIYWRDFTAPGPLKNRAFPPESAGKLNNGSIAAKITVPPGKRGSVRFVISWSFPNCANYWNDDSNNRARELGVPTTWRNYYATIWPDSGASARYALRNWNSLYRETRRFRDALFASDLPESAIDAVAANISILKSPTVLRVEDGTFYGWEGCHCTEGCCEGSCTHVWNYAQALPFLFPKLERSMRVADYKFNRLPSGAMPFRMQLPLGVTHVEGKAFRPCADGQFGNVMKVYRDWKISGDTDWLRDLWPAVKSTIAFAWSPANLDRWDPDKTGVLWGRQHHTLDVELFGPNSWLTGFYLGALKAGAEMAEYLGESDVAREYREVFERGKAWVDRNLFNGEYYHHIVDLNDSGIPEKFDAWYYWSAEHNEIKYQIGEGCIIDQVLPQWHANLYGLGEIYDPAQTRTALHSLMRANFKNPIRDSYNPFRLYCIADEAGLVICAWPEGRRKPMIPICYAQETMHGYEYSAAILMIQTGMVDEGMRVVKAVRDRYDGERRNPWNEIECGSNYARSMASYALLNAFSGFQFNMVAGHVSFQPIAMVDGRFRCFWSVAAAWGEIVFESGTAQLIVHGGEITLRSIGLPFAASTATIGNAAVPLVQEGDRIVFGDEITVRPGRPLSVAEKPS